jgi:hypothetical protein
LLVVDRQDTGNVLAHRLDFGNFGGSSSGYLCHGQFGEFLAVLGKEGEEVIFGLSAEFVGFDHFCIGGYREKETVVSDKREMILYVSRGR